MEINYDDEFKKQEYDNVKSYIHTLRDINKLTWEKIKGASLENLTFANIRKEDIQSWGLLVDHMKKIEDQVIPNDIGKIIGNGINTFTVPNNSRSAWQILKGCLTNKNIYNQEEMAGLERGTLKILNQLSKETTDPIKGLVMGYVQSGKTTSMESLITMAADYGWNFFIMLSGTIENLRVQSLNRLKNDIEYQRNGNIHWTFLQDLKTDNAQGLIHSGNRIVVVCLKNSKRLKDLKDWIFNESTLTKQQMKVLIIDDEADQASLNTKKITDEEKKERSRINKLIVEIVENKDIGAMNYVAYTATPYGNFLNEFGEKSLYPKDFIMELPKSTQYFGPEEVFGKEYSDEDDISEGFNIKRIISKEDTNMIEKLENGETTELPKSLENSICWFLDTIACIRYKKIVMPVSMLIHTNRKIAAHTNMSKAISDWINLQDKNKLIDRCKRIYEEETKEFNIDDFKKGMPNYTKDIENYPEFSKIEDYLKEIINIPPAFIKIDESNELKYHKGLHMVIDNCNYNDIDVENNHIRLEYPKKGSVDYATAFIIVGGDTLARGLTIEGLTTTYFCRKVSQMDTLMQMGRWFGYRIRYELLPRIWMDLNNLDKFIDLTCVESELRSDLEKYQKGISPIEYGPLIKKCYKTNLAITSKNKMQEAQDAEMNYCGAKAQTILFDYNDDEQLYNIKTATDFLNNIGEFKESCIKGNIVKKMVDFNEVEELLLKLKYCSHSSFFYNIRSFCEWIKNSNEDKYKKWNIIVAGTQEKEDTWKIGNKEIGKVRRSIRSENKDENYFSIGSLRRTIDILSDIDENEYEKRKNNLKKEKDMISYRENIEEPQLIIYRINKESEERIKSYNRTKLELNQDLIGIYVFVPGEQYKDYSMSLTIKIPKIEEEEQ